VSCKSNELAAFDAGSTKIVERFLAVLTRPTSVEAVPLQLGHGDGAEIFTTEANDITFDSSERGARATLSAARTAQVQAALFNPRARGPAMPHWSFRANLGFRFHAGSDEVRVVVGLGQSDHFYLVQGQAWQTLTVPEDTRAALTELGTELFGPAVTSDVVVPGRKAQRVLPGERRDVLIERTASLPRRSCTRRRGGGRESAAIGSRHVRCCSSRAGGAS